MGDELHGTLQRLGDEEPVEGVVVVHGEASDDVGFGRLDGDPRQPALLDNPEKDKG